MLCCSWRRSCAITVLNGMDTELSPNEPSGSGTAATDTADIKPSSKGSPYKFYFERLTRSRSGRITL